MKAKTPFLLLILATFLLTSCDPNVIEDISSTSPNGKSTVLVSAEQETWADPWQIKIKAMHGERSALVGIGVVHMTTITKGENLKFDWVSDQLCKISFESPDGEVQVFEADFPE